MNVHQSYNILIWLNKTRKRNGKCAIYLRLTIDSKRIELSTFQYASDSEWHKSLQRLKPTSINADTETECLIPFNPTFTGTLAF